MEIINQAYPVMISFYWFLLKRYIGGRGQKLFSVNAWLSFFGVFIGSSLLVIVLSVFNGFQEQIKSSIFKFDPHIIVENRTGPGKIENWEEKVSQIMTKLGDLGQKGSGMIQSPGLIRKNEIIDQVLIRGVELEKNNKREWIISKDFPHITNPEKLETIPQGDFCLMGRELASLLDLRVGDQIQLIVPKGQFTTRIGVEPGMKTFIISGLFASGNYQYDSKVVILPLQAAQGLFATGNTVQQIAIKLKDFKDIKKAMIRLYDVLPFTYTIRSIEDEHRNLFAALKWEKLIMTIIVFLFIIAALVGVIVSTSNVIRTRRKDIGILKSIGASDHDILVVFTLLGFISGLAGTILGVSFGIFIAMELEVIIKGVEAVINTFGAGYCEYLGNCIWIHAELMPKDVYYFDHLPVSIDAKLIHPLSILAIFLSGLAALLPAWTAGKLQPMEIIRSSDL